MITLNVVAQFTGHGTQLLCLLSPVLCDVERADGSHGCEVLGMVVSYRQELFDVVGKYPVSVIRTNYLFRAGQG